MQAEVARTPLDSPSNTRQAPTPGVVPATPASRPLCARLQTRPGLWTSASAGLCRAAGEPAHGAAAVGPRPAERLAAPLPTLQYPGPQPRSTIDCFHVRIMGNNACGRREPSARESGRKTPRAAAVRHGARALRSAPLVQAMLVARPQHAKAWELCAARRLARLWQGQGRRAEAYKLLAPMYGRVPLDLLSAPLTISLVCCDIKRFRRASRCTEAMARRQKERGGRASHPVALSGDWAVFPPVCAIELSLIARGCLIGATPRGQPWPSAVTHPQGRNGLSVRRMAVLSMFREPSLCHQVHCACMRSALRDLSPIIPATACHQRITSRDTVGLCHRRRDPPHATCPSGTSGEDGPTADGVGLSPRHGGRGPRQSGRGQWVDSAGHHSRR